MTKAKSILIKKKLKERQQTITSHAKLLGKSLKTVSLFLAGGFKSKNLENYFDIFLKS